MEILSWWLWSEFLTTDYPRFSWSNRCSRANFIVALSKLLLTTCHNYLMIVSDAGVWVAQDARHHRHWQEVLAQVAGLHLSTVRQPLPTSGSVLGGTMELRGQHISLACFHGINFKSKSWALFSLKEPCISFTTEAQEVHTSECNYLLNEFIFLSNN